MGVGVHIIQKLYIYNKKNINTHVALVGAAVDIVDVAADGLGDDAGQALDLLLGAVQRGDVDERGDGLGWGEGRG